MLLLILIRAYWWSQQSVNRCGLWKHCTFLPKVPWTEVEQQPKWRTTTRRLCSVCFTSQIILGFSTRFSFSSYKKVTFIRLQMQEQWIIYKCCWCVFACLLGAWVCLHPRTKQCPAPSTNNDISVNPLLPSPFLQTHNRTVCRSVPWPTALHTSTSRLPRVLIDTMGFSGWQSTDVPRTFTNPLIQNHSWWTTQCSIT